MGNVCCGNNENKKIQQNCEKIISDKKEQTYIPPALTEIIRKPTTTNDIESTEIITTKESDIEKKKNTKTRKGRTFSAPVTGSKPYNQTLPEHDLSRPERVEKNVENNLNNVYYESKDINIPTLPVDPVEPLSPLIDSPIRNKALMKMRQLSSTDSYASSKGLYNENLTILGDENIHPNLKTVSRNNSRMFQSRKDSDDDTIFEEEIYLKEERKRIRSSKSYILEDNVIDIVPIDENAIEPQDGFIAIDRKTSISRPNIHLNEEIRIDEDKDQEQQEELEKEDEDA